MREETNTSDGARGHYAGRDRPNAGKRQVVGGESWGRREGVYQIIVAWSPVEHVRKEAKKLGSSSTLLLGKRLGNEGRKKRTKFLGKMRGIYI